MSDPEIPQKKPYVKEMGAGKYAWCACGRSANQPFCDGSHRGSGLTPIVTEITEKKSVAWCGCKHSNKKPFCDGSHKELH